MRSPTMYLFYIAFVEFSIQDSNPTTQELCSIYVLCKMEQMIKIFLQNVFHTATKFCSHIQKYALSVRFIECCASQLQTTFGLQLPKNVIANQLVVYYIVFYWTSFKKNVSEIPKRQLYILLLMYQEDSTYTLHFSPSFQSDDHFSQIIIHLYNMIWRN